MTTPDWTALATAPLPDADQQALRVDIAGDNFLAAFRRAIEMLEGADHPELAEQLAESFLRAFRVQR